ncbi:MAG: PAS domain S-box protein [Gallionella sp.]|nr:PAS domain S-box protein [Gallionella sp.]
MRDNSIRLGLMPPLTGVVEMYGTEITRAGQIACDEINESGGVLGRPLELVIEDDGSLPESAVAAAARLVDHHRCAAIIGNLLSNSRIAVAYQVAEPCRIPYLNFSFYEGSILSHYFFHFAALPNQQIDRMIPYMRERYGPRMFFAGNNYEWPRGSIDAAKRALEQSGGQIVGEEYYPIGASDGDIERLLDQVAESGADVFVPYFAGADQTHLLTRFTERGLKNRMAVVMGHYDEIMASRLPPEVREGFYSSNTYFMTLDTPENKTYLARLAAQPGVSGIWPQGNGILTNFGEGAYLCVKAFAKAANQASSLDPEALVKALETIAVSGPQGIVQMDPVSHHAQVNTYLSRCQADGSFAIIERFGTIPPVLPEHYRHLRISKQTGHEDIYLESWMMAQITEAVLLVHATDGAIVYTNPGAERIFGYKSDELSGKRFSVLFAPSGKSPEEVTAAIGEALSRKGVWQGETENITREGKRFWCAASVSVFTHPEFGEVWMILNKDITERKRAEEELRSSEERFRALADATSEGMLIHEHGRIIDLNHHMENILGRSRAELIGAAITDFVAPAWRDMVSGRVQIPEDTRIEFAFARPDGLEVIVSGLAHPCVYQGRPMRVAAYRDITERKRAEEKLRVASLYARSLIEASLDPLVTISAEGKITDVNYATEEVTGRSRADLIGTDFSDYFTEPDKAREGYLKVFSEGSVTNYPLTIRHQNGRIANVLYNASVYRNEAGEALGVFAAARDITERKQAEESIRVSQARFSTIFNQAPLGIALIDSLTGKIHEVNPRFAEIAGRTIEEMATIDWMSITHPDDVQEDLDNMALMNAGKIPGFNMDKRYLRPDGSFVWINMTIAPLRGEQNISPRHLCMIDDITERKQTEEEVRRLNAELEQRVVERTAELEAFSYSVSHDLRVPLRAIDGFSRLVLKQYEDKLDDEGKRLLNVVRDNTKKMGQLIDDILAFSRAGRLEINAAETDMEALARDVWQELQPSMAGREVRLEIKPLPKVQGDPVMLRQVWVNLLGNAAKFTTPKAVATIEVGGSAAGNECTFYVKDNGVGFDQQYVDKLFGVFQRLHGIEEFEGTGIGLAIVKRIITRHGGRVWAEGKINEGATFYFALPVLTEKQL